MAAALGDARQVPPAPAGSEHVTPAPAGLASWAGPFPESARACVFSSLFSISAPSCWPGSGVTSSTLSLPAHLLGLAQGHLLGAPPTLGRLASTYWHLRIRVPGQHLHTPAPCPPGPACAARSPQRLPRVARACSGAPRASVRPPRARGTGSLGNGQVGSVLWVPSRRPPHPRGRAQNSRCRPPIPQLAKLSRGLPREPASRGGPSANPARVRGAGSGAAACVFQT